MSKERQAVHGKPDACRALVPVEDARQPGANGGIRPLATFLTQMLACRATVADFRRHRRADPPAAAEAYGAPRDLRPSRRFERAL